LVSLWTGGEKGLVNGDDLGLTREYGRNTGKDRRRGANCLLLSNGGGETKETFWTAE